MNSKFANSALQLSSKPKPKAKKIPERAIVAALMPGAPFRAFNGYRLVFSIAPLLFCQLTATIISSGERAKKLLTRATGDSRLRGKKVGCSGRAFRNRNDGRNWPGGAVWSGSNLYRSVRPGVCHGASSKLKEWVMYGG